MPPRRTPANTTAKNQFQEKVDYLEERGPIWQERMCLSHIEIAHHYLDATSDMLLGVGVKNRPGVFRCGYKAGGETTYTAFVETRWNYQMADVYWILPSIIQWDLVRLDQTIVHEYSHIATAAEQSLLEFKLEEIIAETPMTTSDLGALCTLYYERMEMATENVARAVWAGWQR